MHEAPANVGSELMESLVVSLERASVRQFWFPVPSVDNTWHFVTWRCCLVLSL